MKPHLLYRDREFEWGGPLPWNSDDLQVDLDLAPLLDTMAGGDPFLRETAEQVLLLGLDEPSEIVYRQAVVADCLAAPTVVRELYDLAVDILDGERKVHHFAFSRSAKAVLVRAVDSLEYLVGRLRQLHDFAVRHHDEFRSDGLRIMLGDLVDQLDRSYLDVVSGHLSRLHLRDGVALSAELGLGNHGVRYQVHLPPPPPGWWRRLLRAYLPPPPHTLVIDDRDEAGARALSELTDRGINPIANALAQSSDHVLAFVQALRRELGFYVGCVNLHRAVRERGVPTGFPQPIAGGTELAAVGLCETTLALRPARGSAPGPVGSDLAADGRPLVVITGPNQGGKSTFLRATGQAMLLLRAGMFVTAEQLRASVPRSVITHFGRGEDRSMGGGKFEEELRRMSQIADHLRPGDCVLLNEPFATTNAREGAEIGRDIVRALLDRQIRVLLVTHLYDLAEGLRRDRAEHAVFLRAHRRPDGRRTFRLEPGDPQPSSNGSDLYDRVFGPATEGVRRHEISPV